MVSSELSVYHMINLLKNLSEKINKSSELYLQYQLPVPVNANLDRKFEPI